MNKEDLVPLDIALATEARGMFSRLLTDEDKSKIANLRSADQLVILLRHTESWGAAVRSLPPSGVTAELFSLEMERHLYREYERLYRFAQESAREFLVFMALRAICRTILAALRRLVSPNTKDYTDPLPPFFHSLRGYHIKRISEVKSFEALSEVLGDSLYGQTLSKLEKDTVTGLPQYADAVIALEESYYYIVNEHLLSGYAGPDKEGLVESVSLKADLLALSYMMRLRKFNTPIEKAMEILRPLPGTISREDAQAILSAKDDGEVVRLVSQALHHQRLGEIERIDDRFLRGVEAEYFRGVVRGKPTLRVAYAFLMLKEMECNMLKRVYVALQYGFDPEVFII